MSLKITNDVNITIGEKINIINIQRKMFLFKVVLQQSKEEFLEDRTNLVKYYIYKR